MVSGFQPTSLAASSAECAQSMSSFFTDSGKRGHTSISNDRFVSWGASAVLSAAPCAALSSKCAYFPGFTGSAWELIICWLGVRVPPALLSSTVASSRNSSPKSATRKGLGDSFHAQSCDCPLQFLVAFYTCRFGIRPPLLFVWIANWVRLGSLTYGNRLSRYVFSWSISGRNMWPAVTSLW